MSDPSAQPANKMASRFVAKQNSAIGSLIRKGMTTQVATDQNAQSVTLQSQDPVSAPTQISVPSQASQPAGQPTDLETNPAPQPQSSQLASNQSTTDVFEPSSDPLTEFEKTIKDSAQSLEAANTTDVSDQNSDKNVGDLDLLDQAIGEAEEKVESEATEVQVAEQVEEAEVTTKEAVLPTQADGGVVDQVIPQVVVQATDTLNPQHPVKSAGSKESAGNVSLDQVAIDAARGAQQVETEPTPEIPPEVESYLQKVEQHTDTAPPEIVIADGSNTQPNNHNYPAQPVVVLPITPDIEKQGAHKSPKFSVRWLVEWSRKIMKMFSGKVIYRLPEEEK